MSAGGHHLSCGDSQVYPRNASQMVALDGPSAQRQRVSEIQLTSRSPRSYNTSSSNDEVTRDFSSSSAHVPPTQFSDNVSPTCSDSNGNSAVVPQAGWFGLESSNNSQVCTTQSNQTTQPLNQQTVFFLDQSRFHGVPEAVKTAVESYQPAEGFELVPQKPNERSFIFNWGVRVKCVMEGVTVLGWICQGNHTCRETPIFLQLYGGRTSRATKHLKEAHGVSSDKTVVEESKKRSRDEEVTRILAAAQTRDSSQRISLLLQTLLVVNNNLPFVMGEWEESEILKAVITKDEFRAVVNRQTITHAVIELYACGKKEVTKLILENMVEGVSSLTMVVDFWVAKHIGTKFMGLRLYFIDKNFSMRSVLLGTRHFQPMYGERDTGIGGPFKRWILRVIEDFNLREDDFYGATSDGGSDVKRMMRSVFKLKWEWCIPHLTNAATKTAFGLTNDRSKSKNPDVLDLLRRVTQTTFQVKTISSLGDLYEQLTQMLRLGKAKKLVDYKPHRFMGLTKVLQRIVSHWRVLEVFFDERKNKHLRDGKPTPDPFPLANDKGLIEQLLALLMPITVLNKKSQSESPNQVEVLLTAYKLFTTTLNVEKHLPKFDATRENPTSFHPTELHQIVRNTRALLYSAFHKNLFKRYTDREAMKECSYIWEMQMMLHPNVKHLDQLLSTMVRTCGQQQRIGSSTIERNVDVVTKAVMKNVRSIMLRMAPNSIINQVEQPPMEVHQYAGAVFDETLMDLVEISTPQHDPSIPLSLHEGRVDLELQRWTDEAIPLKLLPDGKVEPLLQYWKRLQDEHQYVFLPNVARVIFAVPASSAHIERDFGISGMMVTSQRTCLSGENIDMCSFINRNRSFIDVTQCAKLSKAEAAAAVPSNVAIDLDPSDAMAMFESDWEAVLSQGFSSNISMDL